MEKYFSESIFKRNSIVMPKLDWTGKETTISGMVK
jgi:hypothetical protein